jgi:hypothetical protein
MQEETSGRELRERLDLIECMISEGRRKTESWGWTFVLWGVAYFVAMLWASNGHPISIWGRNNNHAWPITMISAAVLTIAIGIVFGSGKGQRQPETLTGRAIVSIWIAVGISMLLIFPALAISNRLDEHSFVALIASMLAIANGASGMLIRWKSQIGCGIVWWITSVLACFGSQMQLTIVFASALFLCQIVFGIYAMIQESRRRQREIVHA